MPPQPDPRDAARRHAFGEEFLVFLRDIMQARLEPGDAGRRAVVERFRRAVERAALHGIELPLGWHSLGVWTESGKERIGYFARALDCQLAANAAQPPRTAQERWSDVHMQADCLFEIGRIHAHEGAPAVARDFFERALPLAREAEALRAPCKPPIGDDRLEGRILELLLQLPEEGETPSAA